MILETVTESPDGAPSGVMYAAMMGKIALLDFQGLLDIAKSVGLVNVSAHLVTITPKGQEMVKKIKALRAA